MRRLRRPLLDFCLDLCRIPTVNPPGERYLEFVEFAADKLRGWGLDVRLLPVPEEAQARLAPETVGRPRCNLLARWDVGAAKTLHFTGHYDVVPPTAGWKTDPFQPFIKDDKLIGRGTSDMKCALAAAAFAVRGLKEAGIVPAWNVELSFTADEETGGLCGLGFLVRQKVVRPDAAVLCEGGGGNKLGFAHRGVLWLELTVLGKSVHASAPDKGVNALEKACGLIGELKKLETVYATRRSVFPASAAARRPTLSLGGLAGGGTKINTVPDRFSFTIDRRILPDENVADVEKELRAAVRRAERRDGKLRVRVRRLFYARPGKTDRAAGICRAARAAHAAVTGRRACFRMSGGFTDMRWLTEDADVPTVMYGVAGGGAHADFEYAKVSSIVETAEIYAEIIRRMPR